MGRTPLPKSPKKNRKLRSKLQIRSLTDIERNIFSRGPSVNFLIPPRKRIRSPTPEADNNELTKSQIKHMSFYDQMNQTYRCLICLKKFQNESALSNHMTWHYEQKGSTIENPDKPAESDQPRKRRRSSNQKDNIKDEATIKFRETHKYFIISKKVLPKKFRRVYYNRCDPKNEHKFERKQKIRYNGHLIEF